jgi:hypothetical protein
MALQNKYLKNKKQSKKVTEKISDGKRNNYQKRHYRGSSIDHWYRICQNMQPAIEANKQLVAIKG